MCSIVTKDGKSTFALKSSNKCQADLESLVNGFSQQAIAHLICKERNVDYWMRNTRITVGRSSSKRGSADVDMGQSTFISRNHLEIYTTESKFYALVTGKNGIFIVDKFYKKGGTAFELPEKCIIRFPSTDIKIDFETFLQQPATPEPTKASQTPTNPLLLKSNSYSEINAPNNCIGVVDGGLCPISEEVVTQVSSQIPDSTQPCENYFPPQDLMDTLDPIPPNSTTTIVKGGKHTKPPYSYAQLIVQAISSQEDHQLTLSGIYNYITKLYPFYRHEDKGWQNSIRHNLSLNRYFVKVPRTQEEAGKGCFWKIDSNSQQLLISQAFRKRRQRPVPYCRNNSFDAVSGDTGMPSDDPSWDLAPPSDPSSYPCFPDDVKAFTVAGIPFNGSYNPMSHMNGKPHLLLSKPSFSSSSHHFSSSPLISPQQSHDLFFMNGDRFKLDPCLNHTNASSNNNKSIDLYNNNHKKPLIFSTQPKTIILRSTNNNNILTQVNNQQQNLNLPAGSQLIKLSYAPQKSSASIANLTNSLPFISHPLRPPSPPPLTNNHHNATESPSLIY